MNLLFFLFIAVAVLVAGWHQLHFVPAPDAVPPMDALTTAAMDAAKNSVNLSIGMIGAMAFFLGVVKVAEAGGLLTVLSKLIRPLMVLLFPELPPNHPAMGAMILNMAANALGLGNAATPFGLRAMRELDTLNSEKGTATNAMALFLAINTSSVTILPTGAMVWRQTLGSANMAGIVPTTLFATLCSTSAAILASKLYSRFSAAPPPLPVDPADPSAPAPAAAVDPAVAADHDRKRLLGLGALFGLLTAAGLLTAGVATGGPALYGAGAALLLGALYVLRSTQPVGREEDARKATDDGAYPVWLSLLAIGVLPVTIPVMVTWGEQVSPWIVPAIVTFFLGFGFVRGVNVYEVFIKGAKEGFDIAVLIIPYLVAILVAIGMLRSSGALDLFTGAIGPYTERIGLPAEALPMALLRPLSGSGANGIMVEIMKAHGPDSYVGYLVSTLQGSTETTFYVLAVYYGAVNVRRMRHTLAAALTADVVGVLSSVAIVHYYYYNYLAR